MRTRRLLWAGTFGVVALHSPFGCSNLADDCRATLTCPTPQGGNGGVQTGGSGGDTDAALGGGAGEPPGMGGMLVSATGGTSSGEATDTAGQGGEPDGTESAGAGGDSREAGNGGHGGENAGGTEGDGPTARCDVTRPFAPAVFVPSLSSSPGIDTDATVSWDGLTIYVWRDRALLSAKRATPDDTFGAPSQDPLVKPVGDWFKQSQAVDTPTITGDRLAMYGHFGGQARYYLNASYRATRDEAFGDGTSVAELRDELTQPFVSFDGQTLYYQLSPGGLYVTHKTGTMFGTPKEITAVKSPGGAWHPVVSRDELTLYFASDRTDGSAKGGSDVWASTRSTVSDEFGLPGAINELNTTENELVVGVSPDSCEIFLIREANILVARRPL